MLATAAFDSFIIWTNNICNGRPTPIKNSRIQSVRS